MVRIRRSINLRNKKGQLFLLEVFIALTVLVLLMIAIYQVEFTSIPSYQDDLSDIGHNALESLNIAGDLKSLVFNAQTIDLAESLSEALPGNIIWRLSVQDSTGSTLFQIYWDRVPPVGSSVGVTDYFMYGDSDNLSHYRTIHLEHWRIVG